MKYQGLFDIEIFVKGDDIYLNEINFRNSANSYAYMYGNVNIIYLSILLLTDNSIDSIPIKVKEDYYFQDEVRELKNLLCHNITLKEYIKTLKISKSFLVLNKKDLKPVFFKFIYAILRRIDNK